MPVSHGNSDLAVPSSAGKYHAPSEDSEDYDQLDGHAALPGRSSAIDGLELNELEKNQKPASLDENDDLEFHDDEDETEDALLSSTRGTTAARSQTYTAAEERHVKRKLDIYLVLFVALLYMISFLDRSNIGNAKLAGLTHDLSLSDDQYEWLLTIFYIFYILFEWMTLCYRIFPPHIYISCCVCAWGVVASLQAIARSFHSLLFLRALLGIGEAAFVGIPFYLSFFYRREELALRTGLFISAAPLATTFAGSLAFAIVNLAGHSHVSAWRWLFLVEGFPACLIAIWAWNWIPDSPGTAFWFSAREREVAVLRMRDETSSSSSSSTSLPNDGMTKSQIHRLHIPTILRTLRDPKAYLTAAIFFCCNVAFSSMPVFLPTILHAMGYSSSTSQILSAPPFLLAFVVVLATAILSDRLRSRGIPLLIHALLALSGYLTLVLAKPLHLPPFIRYLAVFPITSGFFSAVTLTITWTLNNQSSDEGKGTGMAVLNFIGQLGPLVGTRLYPDEDGPYFVKGMLVCAGAMATVAILALTLRSVLVKENARLDRLTVGRRKDTFRFML